MNSAEETRRPSRLTDPNASLAQLKKAVEPIDSTEFPNGTQNNWNDPDRGCERKIHSLRRFHPVQPVLPNALPSTPLAVAVVLAPAHAH